MLCALPRTAAADLARGLMEKLRPVLGKSYSYSGGEHLVSHKPSLAFCLAEEDGVGVIDDKGAKFTAQQASK
jgi:hypothetical protein